MIDHSFIDGWLFKGEDELLSKYASVCNGNILEIGSFRGKSTVILADVLKEPYKIYTIDVHAPIDYYELKTDDTGMPIEFKATGKRNVLKYHNCKVFYDNITKCGLFDKIVLIGLPSQEAYKVCPFENIDLLFIDGNHNFSNVRQDFNNYSKLINDDGIVIFHDSNQDDIKRVIDGFTEGWKIIENYMTMTVMQKENK